ncbi:MAG: hypothetical protein AAGM40_01765 [Cyanobacteria bacterium J06573_2]
MNILKLLSFSSLSVSRKIYLLIAVAIVPFSISALSSLAFIYNQGEQGKLKGFEEIVARVSNNIDNTIDEKKYDLEKISESEEIIGLLSSQGQTKSNSSTIKVLNKIENYITSRDTSNYLTVLTKKGECLRSCNIWMNITKNKNIPVLKKSLKGESYITLLKNEKSRKAEMLISHPIKSKKGEIIGTVILILDEKFLDKYFWSGFSEIFEKIDDSKVFLIDQNNSRIIKTKDSLSFDENKIKIKQNDSNILSFLHEETFYEQLINKKPSESQKISDHRMYVSSALEFSPSQNWFIGIDLPKNATLSRLVVIILINFLVFLIIGIITVITALRLGKSISKPIQLLTKIAHAVDRGDFEEITKIEKKLKQSKNPELETRASKPTDKELILLNKNLKIQDDLTKLIQIVMQMASRVEQREQNLQKQVEKLHIKLEIDQNKKMRDVKKLTENDEFKNVKSIVDMLKKNSS